LHFLVQTSVGIFRHQTRQDLDHARRADAAVDVDRQAFLGELVG
jgi:hypothetical protein